MQFFAPGYFIFLWFVPAVIVFYWFSRSIWSKRVARLVRTKGLWPKLLPGYRSSEFATRALLMSLIVLLAVLALARPQWGDEKKQIKRKGIDMIFLVDTSLSMLAEDIKPNRLEKSKFLIDAFLKEFKSDRIGMVTFSGSGFLQTPLTLDQAAFRLFLDAVQVGFIPDPGTSLSNAIRLALRAYPQKELKYKSMIILTDGEDHEGGIETAIEEAKKAGVRIYAVGLGSREGEPIPLKNEKGERTGFKRDRSGQMVITKLEEDLLRRIGQETGGIYLPATPSEKEVDIIVKHLKNWGEQEFSEKTVSEREDQYQIFLLFAFILLLSESLIRRREKKIAPLLGCLAAFFLLSGFLETSGSLVDKANEQYEDKQYRSAAENYRKVQVRRPDDPEVLYNLGTVLYKSADYRESAGHLEAALKTVRDPGLKARSLYNLGNTCYRLGDFEAAIDAYKKTLEIDPGDADAKYNLEFLQKQKNAFDKKDQEKKKQDQKKEDQKQQQQKQDQRQDQKQGQQSQQQDQQQGQQQEREDQQQGSGDQGQDKDKEDSGQPDRDQQEKNREEEQRRREQEKREQEERERREREENERREREEQENRERQEQENQQAEDRPEQPSGNERRQPLQGQMSKENALQILDALKDSEKELQDLRRPVVNKNPPFVDKDW
ncbi:MAG: translation initiation factor IF-2 [Candidatus Omnitrophica bacterium ADurb.Bin277]|nr:MAG: translation initiation factor IF-2 [Candidatus Omnitrophica bacterium ADurb.Bin277]